MAFALVINTKADFGQYFQLKRRELNSLKDLGLGGGLIAKLLQF